MLYTKPDLDLGYAPPPAYLDYCTKKFCKQLKIFIGITALEIVFDFCYSEEHMIHSYNDN